MKKKITLLDGAVGTSLWGIAEKNGVEKVPVWKYNVEHPEFVTELVKRYVDAGCEIVLANTFGANGPAVKHSSPTPRQRSYRPASGSQKKRWKERT